MGRYHGYKCTNRDHHAVISQSRNMASISSGIGSSSALSDSVELIRMRGELAAISRELKEANLTIKRLQADRVPGYET